MSCSHRPCKLVRTRYLSIGARSIGKERRFAVIKGATTLSDVRSVFITEIFDARGYGRGSAVTQGTERAPQNVVTHIKQRVEVFFSAAARFDAPQHEAHPVGSLAAGGALTAGFVGVEIGPARYCEDHARGLIKKLQRARTEHRTGRGDGFEVERHIEVLSGQQRCRGTTGRPELQFVAVAHTPAHIEQLAQRDTQRGLVLARAFYVAREREDAVSG